MKSSPIQPALSEVEGNGTKQHWRNVMFEGLFQPTHLIIIFAIALLIFGPKKLPELGKGVGDGIRGFKRAMAEGGGKEES
jgi:sec-independent protein translocase protein TatA